jgi:hypothetical protein
VTRARCSDKDSLLSRTESITVATRERAAMKSPAEPTDIAGLQIATLVFNHG